MLLALTVEIKRARPIRLVHNRRLESPASVELPITDPAVAVFDFRAFPHVLENIFSSNRVVANVGELFGECGICYCCTCI